METEDDPTEDDPPTLCWIRGSDATGTISMNSVENSIERVAGSISIFMNLYDISIDTLIPDSASSRTLTTDHDQRI